MYIVTVWASKAYAYAVKWRRHPTYVTYCDVTITEHKRNTNNTGVT
jgi:hypothetical protein